MRRHRTQKSMKAPQVRKQNDNTTQPHARVPTQWGPIAVPVFLSKSACWNADVMHPFTHSRRHPRIHPGIDLRSACQVGLVKQPRGEEDASPLFGTRILVGPEWRRGKGEARMEEQWSSRCLGNLEMSSGSNSRSSRREDCQPAISSTLWLRSSSRLFLSLCWLPRRLEWNWTGAAADSIVPHLPRAVWESGKHQSCDRQAGKAGQGRGGLIVDNAPRLVLEPPRHYLCSLLPF